MPTLVRLLAVALTSVAATVGLGAAPATAATCATASGVSVVVDFEGLGNGLDTSCVPDGGGQSAAELSEVHHDLTRVTQFPGAVCRVDGLPADVDCSRMPPADAFWGLFWSDGSGGWVFSSEGVDSLDVPAGGSVGWAWQTGGEPKEYPGVEPPQHESPEPTEESSTGGEGGGQQDGGSSGGAGSPSSSPSATESTTASSSASPTESVEPSEDASTEAPATRPKKDRKPKQADRGKDKAGGDKRGDRADRDREDAAAAADDADVSDPEHAADAAVDPVADSGRLPTWVTVVVLAGLALLTAVLAVLRRRRAGGGTAT